MAIFLLIIYPFLFNTKKSFAGEIVLFPDHCQGTWSNSASVAGDPAEDESGGAESLAAGDAITCDSFIGDLPNDAVITEAQLEFIWSVDTESKSVVEPPIEESYDVIPVPPSESEQEPEAPTTNNDEQLPETEEPSQESETIETPVVPEASNEPISRLPMWLSFSTPIAQAEEEVILQPIDSSTLEIPVTEDSQIIGITNSEIPSVSENDSEQEIETNEENNQPMQPSGTSLFNITYQKDKTTMLPFGQITYENLTAKYPIDLTIEDISNLQVALTSLLTIDSHESLHLQGIGLVIKYNKSEDPIRQPDLHVDTVLDDVTIENIEAIRIKRADNKEYEIWYRTLEPEEQAENENKKVEIKTEEMADSENITLPESPIQIASNEQLSEPELDISETIKSEIETPSEVIVPEPDLENVKINRKKDFYWNFIARDDSVHSTVPISLQDGYIFWLNQKGTTLNSFNILTQGYNSQVYQPEEGLNYIIYRNPSSQEKKAILSSLEQKFIFSE